MEASVIHAPAATGRRATRGRLLRLRTDDQLVALFRMGFDEAFGTIHDRYRQRLFGYTRQMLGGSRADAEDALQDVFLRAYSALRQDDRPVTLRAWLYRVAHNRCIDDLRRPVPVLGEVFQLQRGPLRDPLVETERREDLRRLVADVRRLPEQQRSALLMRELEGLTYAELADALRTTVPAVKSLLVRARMGLVEAGEARDTACVEIRADLAAAQGAGTRSSTLVRRHLSDCSGCRDYRQALRHAREGFGAMSPGHGGPLGLFAKLLGLGGGGAAAGASAGAGAGGSAVVVGGAATATATKVAAVMCCAAVVGGGAAEMRHQAVAHNPSHPVTAAKPKARAAATSAAPTAALAAATLRVDPLRDGNPAAADRAERTDRPAGDATLAPADPVAAPVAAGDPAGAGAGADDGAATVAAQTGGTIAPDEDELADLSGDGAAPAAGSPATDTPADPAGADVATAVPGSTTVAVAPAGAAAATASAAAAGSGG